MSIFGNKSIGQSERIKRAKSRVPTNTLAMVREDPTFAATVSKVIKDPTQIRQIDEDGNFKPVNPNMAFVRDALSEVAMKTEEAQVVIQLLPEYELATQILVSSVLAPKDMLTTTLNYHNVYKGVPTPIAQSISKMIFDYIETEYDITSNCAEILTDVFTLTGSYATMIIPENAVDEMIHRGTLAAESMTDLYTTTMTSDGTKYEVKSLGTLGNPDNTMPRHVNATEAFLDKSVLTNSGYRSQFLLNQADIPELPKVITVTDNFNLLKLPEINRMATESLIADRFSIPAQESLSGVANISDQVLSDLVYRIRQPALEPIQSFKTADQLKRRTIGKPMTVHLDSAAIYPICSPGQPDKHVSYLVVLEPNGMPVTIGSEADQYSQLNKQFTKNNDFANGLIKRAGASMEGNGGGGQQPHQYTSHQLDEATRVYATIVEDDFNARLKNGVYGGAAKVNINLELARIMLARHLAATNTQVLIVPEVMVSYIAFRHNTFGIGKSLLEELRVINSMRIALIMADTMSMIKNSIPRTNVNIKFDPEDPNPMKNAQVALHRLMELRQSYLPIGQNPTGIAEYIARAQFAVGFEGHPGLPDMSFDISESQTSFPRVDSDLEEKLAKRGVMMYGLTPEMLDSAATSDLATPVLINSRLLAKRVMNWQMKFEPQLSDHMQKLAIHDGHLFDKIRVKVQASLPQITEHLQTLNKEFTVPDSEEASVLFVDEIARQIISGFNVTLPRPESSSLDSKLEELDKYTDALDKRLDALMSSDFITSEVIGDVSSLVDPIKAMLKSHYLQQWASKNGFLSEVAELSILDNEGKLSDDVQDLMVTNVTNVAKIITSIMRKITPIMEAANVVEQDRKDNLTTEVESTPTESGDDSGDEEGGGDEFSFDDGGDGMPDLDMGGDGEKDADAKPEEGDKESKDDKPEEKEEEPKEEDKPAEDEPEDGSL